MTLGEKISYLLKDEYARIKYNHTTLLSKKYPEIGYTVELPLPYDVMDGMPETMYFFDKELEKCIDKAIMYLFNKKLES